MRRPSSRGCLSRRASPATSRAVINAAAALWVGDLANDLAEGIEKARKSIDSGAAIEKLDDLVRETNVPE